MTQSTIDSGLDEILKKYNNHILYEMGSKIAKEYPRLNSKQTEAALKQWAAQAANKAGKVAAKLNRIELDEILQNYCPTTNNADVIRIRNAKAAITNLIAQEANKARIDEILMMRAVGDAIADKPGTGFEELSAAYDNHILKRAADLTIPELTADKEPKQ